MTDQDQSRFCGSLRSILSTPDLDKLVGAYFDPEGTYAGTTFDLGRDNPPDAFTRDDLFAVSMLGIQWSPRTVRQLLAPEAAVLLAQINHIDLWEADEDRATLTPAGRLWSELQALDGVGPVTAGKLLARKRPRLIPIADSVVLAALQPARGQFWTSMRECLKDTGLRKTIDQLRPSAAEGVSTLRILDVAVWMRCSNGAAPTRRRLGIPDWTAPTGQTEPADPTPGWTAPTGQTEPADPTPGWTEPDDPGETGP